MTRSRVRHHVNPLGDQTQHTFAGFGNTKPIIVDVGADHGEFAQALVEQYGDTHNFVLFEIRAPRAAALAKKFADYDNVVVFDGDAGRNFRNVLEPCIRQGATIDTIYINFPDPWFKDRHKKRRFVNFHFLDTTRKWMPSSTTWIFQTDHKELFDDTVEVLRESGVEKMTQLSAPPHGAQTKWEKAKVSEGNTIFRMRFCL